MTTSSLPGEAFSLPNSNPVVKTFILDTNVLLHDPEAMTKFEDNTVIVPISVFEELDHFKKECNSLGHNARVVSRLFDTFRQSGSIFDGVPTTGGGVIRVAMVSRAYCAELPAGLSRDSVDNSLLAVAMKEQQVSSQLAKPYPVVVVTKDINVRLKAASLGLLAEDYLNDKVEYESLFDGWDEVQVPSALIDKLYKEGTITLKDILAAECQERFEEAQRSPNIYLILRGEDDSQSSAIVASRHSNKGLFLELLKPTDCWGVKPRSNNKEQVFAMDACLNDRVKLVTLVGKAGTGKTLLALAAGLSKTADDHVYRRMRVSRPVIPMGKDIGFLPGEIEDKMAPWMTPIMDNLELLCGEASDDGKDMTTTSGKRKETKRSKSSNGGGCTPMRSRHKAYDYLFDDGTIEVEPLLYIRGRSLPWQYLIVDEAQNLTPHEVKTIITRAGIGTKIILTGDPAQIDNPYLDASSNGLTYVVEKFRDSHIAAHVTLTKGERSELAEIAANIL